MATLAKLSTVHDSIIKVVEEGGYVVIDRTDLESLLADIRQLSEGSGFHRHAASEAIRFIHEALGEPGVGE